MVRGRYVSMNYKQIMDMSGITKIYLVDRSKTTLSKLVVLGEIICSIYNASKLQQWHLPIFTLNIVQGNTF